MNEEQGSQKTLEPMSMKEVMELEFELSGEWFFNGSDEAGE